MTAPDHAPKPFEKSLALTGASTHAQAELDRRSKPAFIDDHRDVYGVEPNVAFGPDCGINAL